MKTIPNICSYGNYASANYGAHTLKVSIGTLTLYFSYETVVAFAVPGGLICSENIWSTTTGRHLNWIEPNHKARLSSKDFGIALIKMLKVHKLA